jgi:hypothetical protein
MATRRLLVWLGPESDGSDDGIQYLGQPWPHIGRNRRRDPGGYRKAVEILDRDYLGRMWVVQEFFLARNLLLFVGRERLNLSRDDNAAEKEHGVFSDYTPSTGKLRGYAFLKLLSDDRSQEPQPEHMPNFFVAWRHQSCH